MVEDLPFAIGIDYGTASGRVVVLDLGSGREAAVAVVPYRHGVIDTVLPGTGERLPPDWALQHPLDYVDVLMEGIPAALREANVEPDEVIGLGVDFTSCTVLPTLADGTPLCLAPGFADRRHAWPKLWKHHAAQPVADRINEAAARLGEPFLVRYGGRISSEWYYPKLLEVFEEDRQVYDACAAFVEATDWIVWHLTGRLCRNSCTAGYKAMWSEADGLPPLAFFRAVNPAFENPAEKLGDVFFPLGTRAGTIRPDIAKKLGLADHVAVATGNVDAMVSVPGVGVQGPGALVMVMGTSICHLTVTRDPVWLPGVTGVVKDGVLPGFYGYEAGQAAVGDMFAWFVSRTVPKEIEAQATASGLSAYEHLEVLAGAQKPGQSGLLALDWWNGNRSILGDADLSGVILGLTLSTSPADIYRALLEAAAFGTRRIVDNFREHGVPLDELVACGGLPQKSPLLMQIYADVCGLPVTVRDSSEIPARGAALFGAVAAGRAAGGFDSIEEASAKLAPPVLRRYEPDVAAHRVYERLYTIYLEVHDLFGRERLGYLHGLKALRLEAYR